MKLRTGLIAVALLLPAAAAAQPAAITGRWATADGKAIVQITKCGAALCGRIVRVLNPAPGQATTDVHNPDEAKRSRAILGMTIVTGLVVSGDYWAGEIYDPKTGRTYTAWLRMDGATLAMKGCYGVFCQTQIWKRAP
jgi:uncharacterized protein (DUF2147 family)